MELDICANKFNDLHMQRDKRHSDDQTKRSSLKKEDPWAYMFEAAKQFTPDFMNEREQDSEAPVNWVDEK